MVFNLFQIKLLKKKKKEKCKEKYTIHTLKYNLNLLNTIWEIWFPSDLPCLNNLVLFPFNQNKLIIVLSSVHNWAPLQDIIRQKASTV